MASRTARGVKNDQPECTSTSADVILIYDEPHLFLEHSTTSQTIKSKNWKRTKKKCKK